VKITPRTPNPAMDTITLSYQDNTVALAAPERFWLAARIEALPDGHPTKRLVAFMALYARDVLAGDLPGPYTDQRALTFARLALVDPTRYAAHRHRTDAELAAALQLPVTAIPAVRRDQQPVTAAPAGARRAANHTTPAATTDARAARRSKPRATRDVTVSERSPPYPSTTPAPPPSHSTPGSPAQPQRTRRPQRQPSKVPATMALAGPRVRAFLTPSRPLSGIT